MDEFLASAGPAPDAHPARVVDEAEALGWLAEGRGYQWICEEYERRYNIVTTRVFWSSFRRRRGLRRTTVEHAQLIPWVIAHQHRWAYPLAMLRGEARRRSGGTLTAEDGLKLQSWLANLEEGDLVVDYDPRTEDGFIFVPRRVGIDVDLVRRPDPV